MSTYIFRRVLLSLLVILLVSIAIFLLMRLLPGDPILLYLDQSGLASTTPEIIEQMRHELGLDRPLWIQYFDWLGGILQGNLGRSLFKNDTVADLIIKRLPITIHLGLSAFILSFFIGITAGVISAIRRGKPIDTIVTVFANMGITAPVFWVGILMIYFFGLQLHLLPIQGYTSPFDDFWLSLRQTIMPIFCLMIFSVSSAARQTRSSMLEVIHQDYIRTAWAKGDSENVVIQRHALKNSLIPVVTLQGLNIRNIFGGSVLVETVFNIPGMGRLAMDGVINHDFALIQGVVLVITAVVVLANLIIDLSYAWLDPRIRYSE